MHLKKCCLCRRACLVRNEKKKRYESNSRQIGMTSITFSGDHFLRQAMLSRLETRGKDYHLSVLQLNAKDSIEMDHILPRVLCKTHYGNSHLEMVV